MFAQVGQVINSLMTLLECKLSESWVHVQPHPWTPPHIQELHLSSAVSLHIWAIWCAWPLPALFLALPLVQTNIFVSLHIQEKFNPKEVMPVVPSTHLKAARKTELSKDYLLAQSQKAWKYFKKSFRPPFWIEKYVWTSLLFDSYNLA